MKILTLCLLLLLPNLLNANLSVGHITSLKGSADIKRENTSLKAVLGNELLKHDSIYTHANSKVQIIFNDETIMSIGKNSQFSIDEYLEDDKDPKASFSLFKGAMRAVTGKIGKINPKKFKVKTKTATIGIRGTNFIVVILPNGITSIFCTSGGLGISNDAGSTTNVNKGFYTQVDSEGKMSKPLAFDSKMLNSVLKNALSVTEKSTSDGTPKRLEDLTEEGNDVNNADPIELFVATDDLTSSNTQTQSDANQDAVMSEVPATIIEDIAGSDPTLITGFSTGIILQGLDFSSFDGADNPTGGTLSLTFNPASFALDAGATMSINSGQTIGSPHDYPIGMQITNISSPYNFEGTFDNFNIIDSTQNYTLDTSRNSLNYFKTVSDLDLNDEISWGEWAIPIIETTNQDKYLHTGHFVMGSVTPASVINAFTSSNIVYTGSLIGRANTVGVEGPPYTTTSFTGSVTSQVDFAADTIDSSLTFKIGADNYAYKINNSITGSTFTKTSDTLNVNGSVIIPSSSNSQGAFFGSDGKTLGADFGLSHAIDPGVTDRKITGAYQAKTVSNP